MFVLTNKQFLNFYRTVPYRHLKTEVRTEPWLLCTVTPPVETYPKRPAAVSVDSGGLKTLARHTYQFFLNKNLKENHVWFSFHFTIMRRFVSVYHMKSN